MHATQWCSQLKDRLETCFKNGLRTGFEPGLLSAQTFLEEKKLQKDSRAKENFRRNKK